MAGGAAFDGAGKRAAFALYYGPMHFLLVREIVRGLCPSPRPPPHPRPRLRHRARRARRGRSRRGRGPGSRAWTATAGPSRRRAGPTRASASTAARRGPTRRRPPCRSRRRASSPRSPSTSSPTRRARPLLARLVDGGEGGLDRPRGRADLPPRHPVVAGVGGGRSAPRAGARTSGACARRCPTGSPCSARPPASTPAS